MARDGLFFAHFAELHPRFRTPAAAILVQGLWAIGLLLSGSYGQLLDYVTFADWIFFGFTAATLFVYRRRASAASGYRAPFHPLSTLLFCAACVYVVAGAIASNPWNALCGTLLLTAGVPVFLFWSRRARWRSAARPESLR
jgi:APA family basic amino acid/polyamine antiporter